MKKSVAIICGGGPAPGINTVISTLVKTFIKDDFDVLGVHHGYQGLFSKNPQVKSFDFEDAASQVIQELGVMVGSEFLAELPEGQRYFTPDQITTEGILLVLEHTVPLVRTAATRETFTFVVTF